MRRSLPINRATPTRKLIRKSASAKDIRHLSEKVRELLSFSIRISIMLVETLSQHVLYLNKLCTFISISAISPENWKWVEVEAVESSFYMSYGMASF